MVRAAARFAIDSSLRYSAPAGTLRLRWITYPRVVLGGILARLYHGLRLPFEYTPLLSLPFLAAGAWLLYSGQLLAGVLCSLVHSINDQADGLAQGYAIDGLPEPNRPRGRMRLRRFLDAYVSDIAARFALYMVFVLRLHESGAVHPILLAFLVIAEIATANLAAEAESHERGLEFHYDFVLTPEVARRAFGRTYRTRVLIGQLSAYHVYSWLPLLGYLLPIDRVGLVYFSLVALARAATLAHRLASYVRACS